MRLDRHRFKNPPREYGILPFWFLNGALDPDEMKLQLRELRDKGMPGIILHGRYGLEMPYIGSRYLERISFAVEEAEKLGLKTWIYDEMNWPSGTADKRVLAARPDLAQRYVECVSFSVRGPWFTYLTGADSRYLDFERSTPVAAFALGTEGRIVDLTPNLSFENVIPWEVPPGSWRLMYIVEKQADYYIDALNPEATRTFLRVGYEPYAGAIGSKLGREMVGFYTDEPAMHYFVTGGDNAIVPWTKDMFRRFFERNDYDLRSHLPHLFFDISDDSARVRYDFYSTLTDLYSDAYYAQIHSWCRERGVVFTGHLLYEEWLRKMIRVEGNLFKHYAHMDVIGVDHLYPIIGTRDLPDQHVAMKVASSAAHHFGSERLLCESFGGIFMDATMQRMKWIADWEYVLGVNLLNPHGFHYTLEGPRKRDWPPSMFYQYPWWHYYGEFSAYISRLSDMLTGGRHVAKVAVLWPINALFGTYTPQDRGVHAARMEDDFYTLSDLLLRLHHDYDYIDEDVLAQATVGDGAVVVNDESYELVVVPPLTHVKLSTVERLEELVAAGGSVLGAVFLPDRAFDVSGIVDVSHRIEALFGIHPTTSQQIFAQSSGTDVVARHEDGGATRFVRTYGLRHPLPARLRQNDRDGRSHLTVESDGARTAYWWAPSDGEPEDVTADVEIERRGLNEAFARAIAELIEPDVVIDNDELFCLHRVKDGQNIYFVVNPTSERQTAQLSLSGIFHPMLWDPSTGDARVLAPSHIEDGRTSFELNLAPVGSAFVVSGAPAGGRVVESDVFIDDVLDDGAIGFARSGQGRVVWERDGRRHELRARSRQAPKPLVLAGDWEFVTHEDNALVVGEWLAAVEASGTGPDAYARHEAGRAEWVPMVPGAWSYQLQTEPTQSYPIPVWYRIMFDVDHVPAETKIMIDGFAGERWDMWVNGERSPAAPKRSSFDSQIGAVDIARFVRQGINLVAVRLTLRNATDGLLDLVKITGRFSLAGSADAGYVITEPRCTLEARPWSSQGYPFFSGRATYRRTVQVSREMLDMRVFLEPSMTDDVLEVTINGRRAGLRLWEPYGVEATELLQPGENVVELTVANTLVNLLEGVVRPSGLAGPPRLVPYGRLSFDVSNLRGVS